MLTIATKYGTSTALAEHIHHHPYYIFSMFRLAGMSSVRDVLC